MIWDLRMLSRAEVVGMLFVFVGIVAMGVLVGMPHKSPLTSPGFGPEWHCTGGSRGGPICIRR